MNSKVAIDLQSVVGAWRVRLGTCQTGSQYISSYLRRAKARMSPDATTILHNRTHFRCSGTEASIEIACISVSRLGFKKEAPYQRILSQIAKSGFKVCPAEAGPAIAGMISTFKRRWPMTFHIAMKPLPLGDDSTGIFYVVRTPDECFPREQYYNLCAHYCDGNSVFRPDQSFVVVRKLKC